MDSQEKRKLIVGELKEIEQEIIRLFVDYADKHAIKSKLAIIFAYLKFYESLTQKQLQKLTGFSLATVSNTLQSFLHSNIISREFLPNTHTNIYILNKENTEFLCHNVKEFIPKLNKHDILIEQYQQRLLNLENQFPKEAIFFIRRLNNFRNYVETQRRAYLGISSSSFYEEDVSKLLDTDEFIEYPKEILTIETEFVENFVKDEIFIHDDPIINKILSYLLTRMKFSQETLISLTGFSRSTISRNLVFYSNHDYVSITKKEYLKPRLYFIESFSKFLFEVIQAYYKIISSWKPKLRNLRTKILQDKKYQKNPDLFSFIERRITNFIYEISVIEQRARKFETANEELLKLKKQS